VKTLITKELVDYAVLGGAVLGGGGGGRRETGRRMGYLAAEVGRTWLVDVEDLDDETWLLMVSSVGAPAAKEQYVELRYYVRAVRLIEEAAGIKIGGIITNEAGGMATVNGWLQAALLGLPVVDAPGNGRAHPTGIMGAIGLERETGYESIQAAIGGHPDFGTYVEIVVRGELSRCDNLVRQAAVQAGGLVAVARNPVRVSYARKNSAIGAIRRAVSLGREMLAASGQGARAMVGAAARNLGGQITGQGRVANLELVTTGGFDVGRMDITGTRNLELTFWNEYMTLEEDGRRIGTFPDLIMTFAADSGEPLTSAEIQEGQEVYVLHVPRERLILGSSLRNRELYLPLERATGKEIIRYVFGG